MTNHRHLAITCVAFALAFAAGCEINIPDLGDIIDGNTDMMEPSGAAIETYASDTAGSSGLAIRPSDGALFTANTEGIYGPIADGDAISDMTPIGGTNLANEDLFDLEQTAIVLAITNAGEFWVGSTCCSTMGIVAPEGGDAEQFLGLLEGDVDASNIKPATIALVPDNFDSTVMTPGSLIVGEDTSFSKLAVINVDDRTVLQMVANSRIEEVNRDAHHFAFGSDGTLYAGRAQSSASATGIQTIAPDGTPSQVDGTLRVSVNTFVVLDNGDLLINGTFRMEGDLERDRFNGLFFYNAASQSIEPALSMDDTENSENDELVMGQDGTIYMSQPQLNRIVVVTDTR